MNSRGFFPVFSGEPSARLGRGRNRVGLAIAKEIIDRHLGRIEVFSEGYRARDRLRVWLR